MKRVLLPAIVLLGSVLLAGCATRAEPADPTEQEQKLTPPLARSALAELIRSKPAWPLSDLDADEWANKPLEDKGKGVWSLGSVIHLSPSEARYTVTVAPQPGAN